MRPLDPWVHGDQVGDFFQAEVQFRQDRPDQFAEKNINVRTASARRDIQEQHVGLEEIADLVAVDPGVEREEIGGDAGLGQARQLIGRGGRAFNAIAALGQPHTQRQPEPPTTEDAYGFLCHELIFMLDSHGFATIGAWRRSWVTGHGSWVSRNQPMADDR